MTDTGAILRQYGYTCRCCGGERDQPHISVYCMKCYYSVECFQRKDGGRHCRLHKPIKWRVVG